MRKLVDLFNSKIFLFTMAQSQLTEYYKQTKSSKENNEGGDKFDFYSECLKQLSDCDAELCQKIKADITNQIFFLREKCEKLQKSINITKQILEEKDVEIKTLRNVTSPATITDIPPLTLPEESPSNSKENTSESRNNATDSTAVPSLRPEEEIPQNIENQINKVKPTFAMFSNSFNDDQLAQLRSIGELSREDSTFVANSLKFIYNGNCDAIKGKTLTGRGKNKSEPKNKLTPVKILIVRNLFSERLRNITKNENETNLRERNFNKHIKNAVSNISRATEKSQINMELQKKLEENL